MYHINSRIPQPEVLTTTSTPPKRKEKMTLGSIFKDNERNDIQNRL